jgi:hypothetical protein
MPLGYCDFVRLSIVTIFSSSGVVLTESRISCMASLSAVWLVLCGPFLPYPFSCQVGTLSCICLQTSSDLMVVLIYSILWCNMITRRFNATLLISQRFWVLSLIRCSYSILLSPQFSIIEVEKFSSRSSSCSKYYISITENQIFNINMSNMSKKKKGACVVILVDGVASGLRDFFYY